MRYDLDLTGLSARNRRMIALGIRGGDGDDPLDIDVLISRSQNMTDLTAEDLAGLEDDLTAGINLILEDINDATLEQAQRARDALNVVRGELTHRTEVAAEQATRAAEILAEVNATADDGEDDADEADGENEAEADAADGENDADAAADAEGDAEDAGDADAGDAPVAADADPLPVAASRVTRVEPRSAGLTRPRRRTSTPDRRLSLVASANVPGIAGRVLDMDNERDIRDYAAALAQVITAGRGFRGPRTQIPLVSIGAWDAAEIYGEERTLRRDAQVNEARIAAVCSAAAIRASGGICADPPLQYDLPVIGTDARPVRDGGMLARFGADRGGIRTFPPVTLSEVNSAVGTWTEANDTTPSNPTTKPCLTMTCPDEDETLVDAITQCLKVGNFRARYFPEQVREWTQKVAQRAAQVAEIKMLTAIGAGSTNVSSGLPAHTDLGTTRGVLASIDRVAAASRNRLRLPLTYPFRLGLPGWLIDNMRTDLAREAPGAATERLAMAEATLVSFFAARNINTTWFLDGESGQMFGAQADGAMVAWPSHVIGYFYPEGSWLHLDGGTLDLGVVRDSTLNSTNDFEMFSEIFENVHFHGEMSYRLDIDICPSGTTSLPISFDPCTLGS